MLFKTGDFVQIRSLASIREAGRMPTGRSLPMYASSSMRGYYGDGKYYPIIGYRTTSNEEYAPEGVAYYVSFPSYGNTYTFPAQDLIKAENMTDAVITNFIEGHRYRLTTDARKKTMFDLYLNWEEGCGETVEFYGDISSNHDSFYISVDIPALGLHGWNIPSYLIAEDLGVIPGYDTTTRRYSCDRCGIVFRESYEVHDNLYTEDMCLCPTCRSRRYVAPYHRYAPHLEFHNTNHDENSNLYFGVELEVGRGGELNESAASVMDIMNKDGNMIYCSHDSSINNGFEIITHPCTYEYHKDAMEKYQEAFNWLARNGYRSHDERTCGLHVHFSRDYFGARPQKSINKLIYMMQKFWNEIVLFSRKDQPSITRYAKPIEEDPEEFYGRWNRTGDHDGHYFALNLVNANTIEFRIFRGTLNLKTYMLTLTLVNNMVIAAKNKTLEEISNMKFEDLLDDDGKEYFDLRRRMKGFGATECSEEVN